MELRRLQIIAAVVLVCIVGAIFWYAFVDDRVDEPELSVTQAEARIEPVAYHPLTGEPLDAELNFFPIAVMYDNISIVRSQAGLEDARIIYEAVAEGDITRFMAIFDSTQSVERVGPIRSVRPYFVDWAREYGGVVMHVGGSPGALSNLRRIDDVLDIDQIGAHEYLFERDESIDAPHNVFTSFSSWRQIGERYDVPTTTIRSWKFARYESETPSDTGQQIEIDYFPSTVVAWVYNPESNNYVRFVNAERHLYTSGEQVRADNVVVIEVPSETVDTIGRQDMETTGSGTAYILTDGAHREATWIKDSSTARTRFIGENQEEISLQPGVTWIQVVPDMEQVTYQELRDE